jgi:hypothetical protein
VRHEKVQHKEEEDRKVLHTTNSRKASWIGHMLRRKCLLKHAIQGKIEGRERSDWRTRKKT